MDNPGALVLTGATGTVGTALLDRLVMSWQGTLITVGRSRPSRLRAGDRFEHADLSDPAATALLCQRIQARPPVSALICVAGLDSRAGLHDLDHADTRPHPLLSTAVIAITEFLDHARAGIEVRHA